MDAELSPLVQRSFRLISADENEKDAKDKLTGAQLSNGDAAIDGVQSDIAPIAEKSVLQTEYRATTNRMLRVSVNGFFESMGVLLGIMQELDVDVLAEARRSSHDQP